MSHPKPLPPNRDGYRYHHGENDHPLCSKYIEIHNSLDANKKIAAPATLARKIIPNVVKLSENDRAQQLKLSDNSNRVTGEKGYSMVRANIGVNRGKYYFEVHIDSMPDNTATRIGWGQACANLQAPLGYDQFGYSWRSRLGTKFHQAKGRTYDKEGGYKQGDTIGCMIELPYGNDTNTTTANHLPTSAKFTCWIVPAKKKDGLLRTLEEIDKPPGLSTMTSLPGSKISFYKNGKFIGVAFEDIFQGYYYPSISLYKSCTVSANFGPVFKFPPEKHNTNSKNHINYQAIPKFIDICVVDNLMADLIFVIDQENKPEGNALEANARTGQPIT